MRKDTEMAKGNLILIEGWGTMFQGLPDDKAGQLIKALYACHNGDDVEIDDPVLSAVFMMMSETVCENARKYAEKCRTNAKNRKGQKTDEYETLRPLTTVDDSAVNKNKKENNKGSKEPKEKDKEKESPAKAEPLMVAARDIISYLNDKTGSRYMASSKATVSMIKARMEEGHTTDDFKKVIDVKSAEWLGTEQEQYLRPETLFCAKHFESYLNQKMPRTRSGTSKSINQINQTISRTGSVKQQNDELVRQLLAGGA